VSKPPIRPLGDTINLSHGSGGRDMHRLLDQLILPTLCSAPFNDGDSASIAIAELSAQGDRLAFTTDSFTITPLVFPGGDIGSLAVNGTVNDLAMAGAIPKYLSCALIIEEGFSIKALSSILQSMRNAADQSNIQIIAGDTKVVHRGAADGLFINTAGIGVIPAQRQMGREQIRSGDVVIVSGYIGDHGAAVLAARDELQLDIPVDSDCQPLHFLTEALFKACPNTRIMRDATRGGVASVLNELIAESQFGIQITETSLPVRPVVRGACEILGLDPLYLANEGTMIAVIPEHDEQFALAAMTAQSAGIHARRIGQVQNQYPGLVSLLTQMGGERLIDIPSGELLPRIC
jgi:hydrogenase expression/formation protein HypE